MSNARQQLLHYITDVERCVAAGAVNVAGTGRLAHHQPLLVQLAQQVPMLQPVVELNHAVTTAHERDAAAHLLNLLLQTRQLRVALANHAATDEATQDVPESGPWTTAMPLENLLRELNSIRNAQTKREALRAGTAKPPDDLRFLNEWLLDMQGTRKETADLATDVLLPHFGPSVLADLDHAGLQANAITKARRLVALCHVDEQAGKAAILAEHPELAEYL